MNNTQKKTVFDMVGSMVEEGTNAIYRFWPKKFMEIINCKDSEVYDILYDALFSTSMHLKAEGKRDEGNAVEAIADQLDETIEAAVEAEGIEEKKLELEKKLTAFIALVFKKTVSLLKDAKLFAFDDTTVLGPLSVGITCYTKQDVISAFETILKELSYNQESLYSIVSPDSEFLYGKITGYLNEHFFYNENITIAQNGEKFTLIKLDPVEKLLELQLGNFNYYTEKDNLFIFINSDIILIKLDPIYISKLRLDKQSSIGNEMCEFGYTEEGYPIKFQVDDKEIVFKQSSGITFISLEINQIREILVKEFLDDSQFIKVCITTRGDKNFIFYLHVRSIDKLIKETFKNSKLKLYDSLNVKQLFTSWARQINDILNYYYFGSLFCVNEEIDIILNKNNDRLDYEDELKAANILYYSVQEQRKQLDIISIYLPKLLECNERDLMNRLGMEINPMPFKILQKQLLSIAGQIQRSLNEIDRALAYIPNAIYPDTNTRSVITASRYRQAGTMGAIGAVGMVLTGAFSLPFIVGSTVNIWNTYKMDKELEEVEKTKVDIYAYQAIDSFKHLMQVLIPYYIDEVNHALFYMFKQISQYYTNLSDSDKVKMELIERISDLYTTKQLPISNTILKPKKNLIEEIQTSINVDISRFRNNFVQGGL